ncbi:MAG: flavin reductase [Actinobacteria bacterium]|nr:flavin reductase [Actinomycetota bacterium]MBI3688543.1 flavin reductase [Actinomycetota bacterium]
MRACAPPARPVDEVGPRDAPFGTVARQLAAGVAVLTAGPAPTACGVTVSTLTLVSYTPPLVSVVLRRGSGSVAHLKRVGGFAANVLAADQERLARYFADPCRPPGMGQLAEDSWRPGDRGPLLCGAIGWLECRLEQVIPAGDHELLLGRVQAARLCRGLPLVSFAGRLHPGGPELMDVHPPDRGGRHDDAPDS